MLHYELIKEVPYFSGREVAERLGYGTNRANINFAINNHCPNKKQASELGITTWRKNTAVIPLIDTIALIQHSQFAGQGILQWLKAEGFEVEGVDRTRPEMIALSTIEQLLGITLLRQYRVGNYRIDGYDAVNKVAYEIDEPYHKLQIEEDKERQQYIEKVLGCTFKRINV